MMERLINAFIKFSSHAIRLTYGTLSTAWGRLNSVRIEVQQKCTEAFVSIVRRLERNSTKNIQGQTRGSLKEAP